ncbi:gastrula zinc finger protein XlCGF26.1-like isoform X2 [Maniola jurtina]|uniref:gastrula zinc finger protein XlCGF26.1-like isoform X2 n=1 Tax=Maniola jurtina TaxID=191418 RepID=UPI001E68A5F6|nr:gastrula zinc finger protein XlCGF26.1-like isoform X2 [Maniola jurtina]
MSEFVELNLPEHCASEDMARINDIFCIFCLRKNVQFINLSTCVHANVLDNLMDIKMLQLDHVLCSWCHSTLEKMNDFKILVLKSFNILSSGLKYNTRNYPQNLSFSKIEQQSAIDSQPIEYRAIEHTIKSEPFETDVEIKVEEDELSDFGNDIPLAQINNTEIIVQSSTKTDESLPQSTKKNTRSEKIESSLSPSKKKPKSNKKTERQWTKKDRCEDKVKIIVLSEQEMLEDRRLNALKSRYLKLPYKCEKCITSFDHEVHLIEHMMKRHKKEEGSQVCNICESVLNTKISFEEHYKRHYRRYECVKCGIRGNNVYSVLKHYKETHGKVDLTFACHLCDFTTESVHKESNRVYSCEPCGKVYRTKTGLSSHMALKHSEAKPAYCVTCDLNFITESSLRHHLKTASRHISDKDKKFTCNECDAKFLTKKLLQEHIDWVHLKNTSHTCNKCSKIFKNERNLKRHHLYVHDKIRPPRNKMCDHCGRGFHSSTILLAHIRTHTGERPLKCTHCAATFAHSAALYNHNKLLHNKKK